MRSAIRSREKSSVSEEATHSRKGRVRTRLRYSFPIKRVAGRTSFARVTRSRSSPVASASLIQRRIPPDAAECRIGRARKNDRVLYWNDGLVVIPIQRPGLQLSAVEFAFVHEQVEGMLVMIALFADLAQSRAQFLKRHRLGSVGHVLLGYGSSCQLSSATSQPD